MPSSDALNTVTLTPWASIERIVKLTAQKEAPTNLIDDKGKIAFSASS